MKRKQFSPFTHHLFQPLTSQSVLFSEIEDDNSSSTETFYNPIDDHVESNAMMSDEEGLSAHMTISTPTPKKQKKIAKDVTEVRRSSRIAKLCDGFKDKAAADMAKACMPQTENDSDIGDVNKKNKKTQVTKKSNKTSFSTSVIDSSAPPPPEPSIDNVQAIGVGQCMISPEEFYADKLNATSG
jgi:hypothetical protein